MAKKKSTSKKGLSGSQRMGIGVGLTAAAVAAAGTYFLYGSKNAAQNRRKVKSWMLKAKAEVLEGLEKAEQMSEREFNQLVESVGKSYAQLKDASQADIAAFKREMKEHWPNIVKEGKAIASDAVESSKEVKKTAKKKVKKTAKKVAKKASKKK